MQGTFFSSARDIAVLLELVLQDKMNIVEYKRRITKPLNLLLLISLILF